MRLPLRLLAACCIALGFMGCGSKFLMNQNYVLDTQPRNLMLVVWPIASDDPALYDTLFCKIFDDSAHSQKVVCPQDIRSKFDSDPTLPGLLDRLAATEFSKEEIKTGVTVNKSITTDELTRLREASQGADIALFPVRMGTRGLGIVTSGSSIIRLLDLRSGAVIYENTMDMNVNYAGDIGKKFMVIGLIGFAKDDYVGKFWDRFSKP
jgi:hypothetical protein